MFDNWINEWEYPNIGIPFGETQSAGHDMYFMDFSVVDENGEPRIVQRDNFIPIGIIRKIASQGYPARLFVYL